MAAFTKFHCFVEDLAHGKHSLASDTLKVMLTNTAPSSSNTVAGDITQISAGTGYTTGGTAATTTSSAQTSGTYKLVLADVTFTATGAMGPFRYAVLYNDTSATDPLIGYWDYGSSITSQNGETFTTDFDATSGVLTNT